MSVLTLLVLFIGSMIGMAIIFMHAAGPTLVLFAITPFDAIPWAYFRGWGNVITYIPVLLFLMITRPDRWPGIFMGTRIQQVGVALMLALLASHVLSVSILGYKVFEAYARKLTLLILAGLFAHALSDPKHILILVKTLVVSMTLFLLTSASDFYLGIQILPISTGDWGEEGALSVEYEKYLGGALRFSGAGIPINRTANWAIVPFFMAAGWYAHSKRYSEKFIAGFCATVCIVGLVATVSRSAMLGVIVGMVVLAPLAFRINFGTALAGGIAVLMIGGTAYTATTYLGADQNNEGRWDERALTSAVTGRWSRVFVALEMWAENPVLGVGSGAFKRYSDVMLARRGDIGGRGAHNSYTEALAETGLLGFIPLMTLLVVVFRQFLVSVKRDFPDVDFWRPYFFAGFAGNLASIWFNVYHWERFFWVTIAYAIVLERYSTLAAQKRRVEHAEALQSREDGLASGVAALGGPLPR